MKRLSAVLAATLALTACKKAAPPAPFTGKLTTAIIMSAKDLVHPFDPWDDAFARLQSKLGAPTHVKQSANGPDYQWAVEDGDACTYIEVGQEDGKKYKKEGLMVGAVQSPMTVTKDGPSMNRADCLKILGKDGGPPEDPNAAGPPADGVATPELVLANAVKGRSKWAGKKLTITTTLEGTGGLALTLGKAGLTCVLAANAPADLVLGGPITVEGTVKMETWVSGTGTASMTPSLEPCTIKK